MLPRAAPGVAVPETLGEAAGAAESPSLPCAAPRKSYRTSRLSCPAASRPEPCRGGHFSVCCRRPLYLAIREPGDPRCFLPDHQCQARGGNCERGPGSLRGDLPAGEVSSSQQRSGIRTCPSSSHENPKTDSIFQQGCRIRSLRREESLCPSTNLPRAPLSLCCQPAL